MRKKLIKGLKYWGQVFLFPIYWISLVVPRSKKIWVLGSTFGRRFADNPKYFYLYLNQYHSDDIKTIWISRNKDVIRLLNQNKLEAYYLYSLKGIFYCLRAKVYIYDNYSKDICFTLSGGALKLNMWHGIPLKKINRDNKFDTVRNSKLWKDKLRWALRRMSDEKPSHYVLTTSEFLRATFSSAFGTKKVLTCGYPRNDYLISDKIQNIMDSEEIHFYMDMRKFKGVRILYMPTFRDKETTYWKGIDINSFQKFLKDHNMIFCVKLHPKSKLISYFTEIDKKYDNIIIVNAEWDPYQLLKFADILITDYSSTYFDFLLQDRPIIFFDYDLDEYMQNSRELYFDYDEFTPGIKAKTIEDLKRAILAEDEYAEKRLALKRKVFDVIECSASETIYQKICSEIR
jgi:Putative glycosyl/glycerophosphate transferases involved in teichoic acid biosynthesis TagF/TagB/EpsJ/RodC